MGLFSAMLDLRRLTSCDASALTCLLTSSWTGFSVICFHLKAPVRSSHSCSEQRISALMYHTRRGCGIKFMRSNPRQGFRPSFRWIVASGQPKAPSYPNGDGLQPARSKKPHFSIRFSSSPETVAWAFGSQTSFKAAIVISTTEIARHHWGEEQRPIFASM